MRGSTVYTEVSLHGLSGRFHYLKPTIELFHHMTYYDVIE